MNIDKLIAKTTLPASLQASAVDALQDAEKRARGLLWAKWKVRLFMAGKISKMLAWKSERLNVRVGYEIDNVFRDGVQQWYPIPGYDLRAPLTYSVLPGRG